MQPMWYSLFYPWLVCPSEMCQTRALTSSYFFRSFAHCQSLFPLFRMFVIVIRGRLRCNTTLLLSPLNPLINKYIEAFVFKGTKMLTLISVPVDYIALASHWLEISEIVAHQKSWVTKTTLQGQPKNVIK